MTASDGSHDYTVIKKTIPTFYFVGVTTTQSSIMQVFPRWMKALGRAEVVIEGIDHPLHDNAHAYRQTAAQIKYDPLSLGGLVTTHKINLLEAARDLFDELDESARLLGEVSCISKREGWLIGHAKDPLTSGLSLEAIIPDGHFGHTQGHVLCFGAGGAGKAIALHFMKKRRPDDQPARVVVTDPSPERLKVLRAIIDTVGTGIDFDLIQTNDPTAGDQLMAHLPEGSVVINATGMGKDIPGSPVTNKGLFPQGGIVWELNYRGALDFWHQAMAQSTERHVKVEDGWLYFLHGWTQVIAEVLDLKLDKFVFETLADLAHDLRPALVFDARKWAAQSGTPTDL